MSDQSLALVLSGGGARGAFQAGVWSVLAEDDRFADPGVLSGTSCGAINSALIATGNGPDYVRGFWFGFPDDPPAAGNRNFVRNLARGLAQMMWRDGGPVMRATWRRLRHKGTYLAGPFAITEAIIEVMLLERFDLLSRLMQTVPEPYLLNIDRLRERVIEYLGGETVPARPDIKLGVTAVDARTRSVVHYVNHPIEHSGASRIVHVPEIHVDMLVGSSAVPFLFPPSLRQHDVLWDGGILATTPLAPAAAFGATRIVPVLSAETPQPHETELDLTVGSLLESLIDTLVDNTYRTDRLLLLARNEVPGYRTIALHRAIRPVPPLALAGGDYFDFTRESIERMFDGGVDAGRRWLEAGAPLDAVEAEAAPGERQQQEGA